MNNKYNARRKAFTLIELLVVIVIIAYLVAMLLPSLAKSKRPRIAGCVNNFRQEHVALTMWLGDNNDWLPPGQGFTNGLWDGQSVTYYSGTKDNLVAFFWPYLGYPDPATISNSPGIAAKVLLCPGVAPLFLPDTTVATLNGLICYELDGTMNDTNRNAIQRPFGYPAYPGPANACSPLKMSVRCKQW